MKYILILVTLFLSSCCDVDCVDYSSHTATLLVGGHGGGSRSFLKISKPIIKNCKCMYEVDGLPPKSLCEIDFIYDENGVAVHDLWSSLNNLCKKVGE